MNSLSTPSPIHLPGGSNVDIANAIAIDTGGNVYVAGRSSSTDFPGTTGGYQSSYGSGSYKAFIAKLNSSLTSLLQATYLGGSNYEEANAIAIDTGGNVYVAGIRLLPTSREQQGGAGNKRRRQC